MPPPEDASGAATGPDQLPSWLLLVLVLVLTLLLTVWAAFLVPLRLGGVLLPVWLAPLAGMLAMAGAAARRLGLAGALAPALLWLAVSGLGFGATRDEGDLVVPPTLWGYAYLVGGLLAWAWLVMRAAAAEQDARHAAADRGAATPSGRSRR